jgi:hypothetical protein
VSEFCSPFDEALAHAGPAALFLPDHHGELRFDVDRTRDAWERAPGPHPSGWTWVLLRDHATGFVNVALVTAPSLVAGHPRASIRAFADRASAEAARAAFGTPPIARDPW